MTGDTRPSLVVGASRGFGRGIATALAEGGAPVIAVARSATALDELASLAASVRTEVADATDDSVAPSLLDRYQPQSLIIVAGASPPMRPLHEHTWETFSANWNADVRVAFLWLRAALVNPLPPGARVIVFSSGAALKGSPLSGGYAGAKATQRFITAYAQDESRRAGLGLTFTAVLPQLSPATELGLAAVRAYASRAGHTVEEHLQQMGEPLTPETAGRAVVDLLAIPPERLAPAYRLSSSGLDSLG